MEAERICHVVGVFQVLYFTGPQTEHKVFAGRSGYWLWLELSLQMLLRNVVNVLFDPLKAKQAFGP
jgi:hypothetical protein